MALRSSIFSPDSLCTVRTVSTHSRMLMWPSPQSSAIRVTKRTALCAAGGGSDQDDGQQRVQRALESPHQFLMGVVLPLVDAVHLRQLRLRHLLPVAGEEGLRILFDMATDCGLEGAAVVAPAPGAGRSSRFTGRSLAADEAPAHLRGLEPVQLQNSLRVAARNVMAGELA